MVDFKGKLVLLPMVRIGELPTRLLALRHGCDIVWGPEIIDKSILQCDRFENTKLNTVDFLSKRGSTKIPGVTNLVFRTAPSLELGKLIFQMGTSNADLAVNAAKIVIKDVSGIDINAGCPKHFSIHSGMGAALLSTPDLLCEILTKLVTEVGKPNNKPISVKIRLLPTHDETMDLVDKLLSTGISNLTLHCRTKTMRNREPPIRDYVEEISNKCKEANVTFIINGDIKSRGEYNELQEKYGKDVGCMIASLAEINPTCFKSEGPLVWFQMIKEFVQLCTDYQNWKGNTKYCLTRMIPSGQNKHTRQIYQQVARAKDHDELVKVVIDEINDEGEYLGEFPNTKKNNNNNNNKVNNSKAKQQEQKVKSTTAKRSLEIEEDEENDLKKFKLDVTV